MGQSQLPFLGLRVLLEASLPFVSTGLLIRTGRETPIPAAWAGSHRFGQGVFCGKDQVPPTLAPPAELLAGIPLSSSLLRISRADSSRHLPRVRGQPVQTSPAAC